MAVIKPQDVERMAPTSIGTAKSVSLAVAVKREVHTTRDFLTFPLALDCEDIKQTPPTRILRVTVHR
jgi:hypothetical protein